MTPIRVIHNCCFLLVVLVLSAQLTIATTVIDGTVAAGGATQFKTLSGLATSYNPYCGCYGYAENAVVFGMDQSYNPQFANNWIVTNKSTNLYAQTNGGGGTTSVDYQTITFSNLPVVSYQNRMYFVLMFDSQETQQGVDLSIDFIQIRTGASSYTYNSTTNTVSGGTMLWTTSDTISLNTTGTNTKTPLGQGADFAIYIPVRAFDSANIVGSLTGNTQLTMIIKESRGDNGSDEWGQVQSFGSSFNNPTFTNFATNQTIQSNEQKPTPEPATFVSAAGALAAVWYVRGRRSRKSLL